MNKFLLTLGAAAISASGAMAATFDPIYIESTGNRPGSTGDITGVTDIGLIGPSLSVGIAGRIVTAVDTWSFQTNTAWSIGFVDLPIDDQQFFDSSDITNPVGNFAGNGDPTSAIFSIIDASDNSVLFSNLVLATDGGLGTENALDYTGVAGSFFLKIDGQSGSPGATYDIGLTTVPLPAAGLLLLAGVGGLGALKRRQKKA